MAIWDRFRRKEKVILPEEVNQYYQSQRRERVGVAIVLGVVALVITLLIAAALFFGGRFVYRKITGNDQKPTTSQEGRVDDNSQQSPAPGEGGDTEETPAPQPQPAPAPTPAPAPAPAPQPQTTPSLGDDSLPRTGDEGM